MFKHLLPSVHASALVATVAHTGSIAYLNGDVGLESLYIACLTYLIAMVAALPFGLLLLPVVYLSGMGLFWSLMIFQLAALVSVIGLSFVFFGVDSQSLHMAYVAIAVLSASAAWYRSVYYDKAAREK